MRTAIRITAAEAGAAAKVTVTLVESAVTVLVASAADDCANAATECGNPIPQGDTIAYTGPLNGGRPVHLACTAPETSSGLVSECPDRVSEVRGVDA